MLAEAVVLLAVFTAGTPAAGAAVLPLGACSAEALRALVNGAATGDVLLLPACTIPVAGAAGDDANPPTGARGRWTVASPPRVIRGLRGAVSLSSRCRALYERMGFVKTGERTLPGDPNQTREYRYERAV